MITIHWIWIMVIIIVLLILWLIDKAVSYYKAYVGTLSDLSINFPTEYIQDGVDRVTEFLTAYQNINSGYKLEWKVYCLVGLNETYIEKLTEVCEKCQFTMVSQLDYDERSCTITFIKL